VDQSLALLISIALILILLKFRIDIGISIFIGSMTLGFLTIGSDTFSRFVGVIISIDTIKLMAIFLLAFTLAYSMQELSLLDEFSNSVLSIFGRSSTFIIPALVGLLPMPGGAIVSAVMLRNIVSTFKIRAEDVTYLNYWFRHVWATIDPIYPSVIIALAVLEISYLDLLKSTYLITIAMIVSGSMFIRRFLGKHRGDRRLFGLIYLYPILSVILLTVSGIYILYSLLISIAILYIHRRPGFDRLKVIAGKVFNVKMMILVLGLLFYKDLINYTNSALRLLLNLSMLNIPLSLIAFIMSFLIGFATGIETGYSAIALPILSPFIGTGDDMIPKNLMLVFGAGLLGVMMSPLHLCLILTTEYYSADLGKVYRRLIPSGVVLMLIICILYVIA